MLRLLSIVLLLCVALGLACEDGDGDAEGDGANDVPGVDGPNDGPGDDPGSPGLEPPNTNGDGTSAPQPGDSSGNQGATPADPNDMAGMDPPSGVMADGGANGDGGTGDPCSGRATCGVDSAGCSGDDHCIDVPSCGGPVCIPPDDACELECGRRDCAILESYPEQLGC